MRASERPPRTREFLRVNMHNSHIKEKFQPRRVPPNVRPHGVAINPVITQLPAPSQNRRKTSPRPISKNTPAIAILNPSIPNPLYRPSETVSKT